MHVQGNLVPVTVRGAQAWLESASVWRPDAVWIDFAPVIFTVSEGQPGIMTCPEALGSGIRSVSPGITFPVGHEAACPVFNQILPMIYL